jgi:decaprenyl-phosphate phosphoribosyltransferase
MNAYLKLIRIEQYIKNVFVLSPLFFDGAFDDITLFAKTVLAAITFALAASSIYIINDFFDINEDRAHPIKCKRPLASGKIKIKNALLLQMVLMAVSLGSAYWLSIDLFWVICGYIGMNMLYSKWLKHVAILDINIIAIGFVLRLLAGTAVSGIKLSIWILLITYLLALFLAIAKRRTDIVLAKNGHEVRRNIKGYSLKFVDTTLGILASGIIVCYIFYCISPENQLHYHSSWLYVSIVFVINGIFRYLKLALVHGSTYSPTVIVLKDRFLQITILCWVILMGYLLYGQ